MSDAGRYHRLVPQGGRRRLGRVAAAGAAESAIAMPLSGRRILIVEDEALIALDLEATLQQLHAIVVGSINNVADARKIISEQQIDCAVLDVQLMGETIDLLIPDLDSRRIPRVFMTALAQEDLPNA